MESAVCIHCIDHKRDAPFNSSALDTFKLFENADSVLFNRGVGSYLDG